MQLSIQLYILGLGQKFHGQKPLTEVSVNVVVPYTLICFFFFVVI